MAYLSTGSEWTFDLIRRYDQSIAHIAAEFGLDTYPNQIEIITAEQMLDAYASSGLPLGYNHWSYGKHFLASERGYQRGLMGLAYEIVINSNPCIAYLMEENTMPMQALTIAHACYGHNSFFKGNYLFRTWTNADAIVDYLLFAKNYVAECEQRYGEQEVELLLDSCHALQNYGVDRYRRPKKLSINEEQARQAEREKYLEAQVNDLWRTLPTHRSHALTAEDETREPEPQFPPEPEENLLYFIEKNAPKLQPWQREIVRIVRKIAQYFYPQRQTKVMNEGWATFWHYTILHKLYDEKLVNDAFMLELLQAHTNVIYQPPFNSPYYNGLNPYTLGFLMFQDIRRICETPDDEDYRWAPEIAGSDWRETLDFAMRNFKDESFLLQFLSPRVIRELKLFSVLDDDRDAKLRVTAIHDEDGYRMLRELLASQYDLSNMEPNIQVTHVDIGGDRSLTLRHLQSGRRPLASNYEEMLRHVVRLWGFTCRLEVVYEDGRREMKYECKPD
ncbi:MULTISPECIES: SpoVR family protein [Ralstonia]|uniref:SpoVR family protein n=1 Tax=Ralstonia mannitolilytica TaxID=105219 RepID=A0A0D5AR76_9RALS|nr:MULTISPECIES: SpoVR family protein [Ralstonia]ATG19619.1 SpoVR family protein [Ralstonia pickettii]AJW45572.1 SpoVR family protein [Ralstonia mannitolilytica]ANA32249.1 SpoVR family protein [Ralstonia mannitolilytica]MBY4720344.1 SpoVR family protein [Ralstonia mannitolilytica]PLT19457.1 SpoVR family protein [Ralstonia mannitolilytica]